MQVFPNSDWILVNKAVNDHVRNDDGSVLLYKTDHMVEFTCWARIVEEGPSCKHITEDMRGMFILCPELSNDMKEWPTDDGNRFFFVRERLIMNDKAKRGFVVKV